MRSKLFATKFSDVALTLEEKSIPYSEITAISHFNRRHIQNFVPTYESFCIWIKHGSGQSTLLYDIVRLRQYAGAGGLRTGFKIPADIEAKITNVRYEYLATIKLLSDRSSIAQKRRGVLFENAMEILAVFKRLMQQQPNNPLKKRRVHQNARAF